MHQILYSPSYNWYSIPNRFIPPLTSYLQPVKDQFDRLTTQKYAWTGWTLNEIETPWDQFRYGQAKWVSYPILGREFHYPSWIFTENSGLIWSVKEIAVKRVCLTSCIYLAGRPGFEPGYTESESVVLPLNDPPAFCCKCFVRSSDGVFNSTYAFYYQQKFCLSSFRCRTSFHFKKILNVWNT